MPIVMEHEEKKTKSGEGKPEKGTSEPMPDVEAMPDDMDFDDEVLGMETEGPSGEVHGVVCLPCEPPIQLDIAAVQRPPADS